MNRPVRILTAISIFAGFASGCRKAGESEPGLRLFVDNNWNADSAVKEFESENPGTKVLIEKSGPSDDYHSVLLAKLESETPPDVFGVSTAGFGRLAEEGVMGDLATLLEKDPELKASLYFPNVVAAFSDDGKYFALPMGIDPQVIFWNKKVFATARVSPPRDDWTWDDVRRAAIKLTKRDGKGRILQAGFDTNFGSVGWMYLDGGSLVDDDARPSRFTLDTPESVRSLLLLRRLIIEDRVTQDYSAWTPGKAGALASQAMFVEGRLAMLHSQPWISMVAQRGIGRGDEWDVIRVPASPAGRGRFIGGAWGYAIRKGVAKPRLVWTFVKALAGVGGQRLDAKAGVGVPAMKSVAAEWTKLHGGNPANKKALVTMAEATSFEPRWSHWAVANNIRPGPQVEQLVHSVRGGRSASEFQSGLESISTRANIQYFPEAVRQDWQASLKGPSLAGERQAWHVLDAKFSLRYPVRDLAPMAEAFLTTYPKSSRTEEVRDVLLAARIRDEDVKPLWPVRWNLAGPFDFDRNRKIGEQRYGPEKARISLSAVYPGAKGATVRWTRSGASVDGLMDFKATFGREYSVAYAVTWIHSPRAQPAVIALTSDDGAEIWVNGRKAASYGDLWAVYDDPKLARVALKAGANELLVKVAQLDGPWEFRIGVLADAPVHDAYGPGSFPPDLGMGRR